MSIYTESRFRGGISGGGGFSLGPVQNTFTGADLVACRLARDTYTAANAVWLSAYNANRSFIIYLNPTTGADAYERRGASGLVWDVVTFIIRERGTTGQTGPTGAGGATGATGPTGPRGFSGTAGLAGAGGWSPVLGVVNDGLRRVFIVNDWTGGSGTKPTTGEYVATHGLVTAIADAHDIRGPMGAPGTDGSDGAMGFVGPIGPTGTAGADGADGAAGADGAVGRFVIRVYRNTTTIPAAPTGGSYNIDTGILTPPTFWTEDPGALGVGDDTYFVQDIIDPSIQTGVVTPTWSVVLVAGGTGPVGPAGPRRSNGRGRRGGLDRRRWRRWTRRWRSHCFGRDV